MVDQSPWPLFTSFAAFCAVLSIVEVLYFGKFNFFLFSSFFLCSCFLGWQKDILKEAFFEGSHTLPVQTGLKQGMILFIISEVFFFFSFFWSLFHYKTSPTIFISSWPPQGVESVSPFEVPLLGTLILLSSGVSITWSHHSLLESKWMGALVSLLITVLLGIFFSKLQLTEYFNSSFSISDSVFGSTFYLMTGFHGFHVLVGSIFLLVNFFRLLFKTSFTSNHHVGFEAASWYWHFVDVVWLFLFVFLYY